MDALMAQTVATPRLLLTPVTGEIGRTVLAGDFSRIETAQGWPHDDTLDALRMAFNPASRSLIWFVTLQEVVIGECGTLGLVDEAGDIELGFGLAAEHRGVGYGNEVARALSEWLISQPGVGRVVARGVLANNTPSRRALQNAGFVLEKEDAGLTWYALSRE
jgi:RimJ/RimL family protein N-acetyltransferase